MPTDAKPILVIGSLNMDLVARCEHLPAAGQTIFGNDFFTAPGGKGANQAVAAARLGARVAMAGCVGQDAFGDALVRGLRDAGIGTDSVTAANQPTGTALITIDADGANTIVVISGANSACDAARVDHALTRAARPGILLLQHEIPPAATAHAIRAGRAAGWFIVLNPAPAQPIAPDLLPLIDVIAPNESEAAAITERPAIADRAAAVAAARQLVTRGARSALVTLGADGVVYCDGSGVWHCPALAVQAVDTTAAGDAYLGALATELAIGRTVRDSLGFAAAAASVAVTRLGAQPSLATRAEVAELLARQGAPQPQPVAE